MIGKPTHNLLLLKVYLSMVAFNKIRLCFSMDLLLTSNFISQTLRLNNGDVVNNTFVEMEVLGQSRCQIISYLLAIVLLDDSSGGSLDSLGSNSSHCCV